MDELKKSAIWAFISIPITLVIISNSYALAHGSMFLLIFIYPGLAAESLLVGRENSDLIIGTVGFVAQYIAYFLLVYLVYKLKKK